MKPVEYQNILAVDHLEKGYNYISSKGEKVSCPVLENISFQIEPKEFVGIMGRSGCGKTTLLKVLGMLDKPEKGTVFYKGKDTKEIYGTELAKIRRTELSFIFQDFCLMDSLSIKDNILLPRILDEAEIEESKKICENLTKKFNINKLLNKKPYELSGGEKQRVAICRALINNPQIILADEPTGNLDSNSSEVVMRTLESINGEMGKTILLVTHDPMIASFSIIKNYYTMLLQASTQIIAILKTYPNMLVSKKRLNEILNIPSENNGNTLLKKIDSVKLEDFSFSYNSKKYLNTLIMNFIKEIFI